MVDLLLLLVASTLYAGVGALSGWVLGMIIAYVMEY